MDFIKMTVIHFLVSTFVPCSGTVGEPSHPLCHSGPWSGHRVPGAESVEQVVWGVPRRDIGGPRFPGLQALAMCIAASPRGHHGGHLLGHGQEVWQTPGAIFIRREVLGFRRLQRWSHWVDQCTQSELQWKWWLSSRARKHQDSSCIHFLNGILNIT